MLHPRALLKFLCLLLVGAGMLAFAYAAQPAARERLLPWQFAAYWSFHALLVAIAAHRFVRPVPVRLGGGLVLLAAMIGCVYTDMLARAGEPPLLYALRLLFFAGVYFGIRSVSGRAEHRAEDAPGRA